METTISEIKHIIQWISRNQLEEMDFTDDSGLHSRLHQRMHVKKNNVAAASALVDLNMQKAKSKILKCNTENTSQRSTS